MKGQINLKVYQKIAQIVETKDSDNSLCTIERDYLPQQDGFRSFVLLSSQKDNKLIIDFEYDIRNDEKEWIDFLSMDLILTPSLSNLFDIKFRWHTKNDKSKVQKYKPLLEEYFYDEFHHYLMQDICQDENGYLIT